MIFISSAVNGYLNYYSLFVIMNKGSINICGLTWWCTPVISARRRLRQEASLCQSSWLSLLSAGITRIHHYILQISIVYEPASLQCFITTAWMMENSC